MRIGIIGNGKMAVDCAKMLLGHPKAELVFFNHDPQVDASAVPAFCRKNAIDAWPGRQVNSEAFLGQAREASPDIILNINSFRLLRAPLLQLAPLGVLNFHNGPLPRYGGVNIPSWALLKGEARHGVTWHFMDQDIDTGPILAQRLFDLEPDETAASLMVRCIREGIALFGELLPVLLDGTAQARPQDGPRSYFSRKDLPENGGKIDLAWPFAQIERMARALNWLPFENPFVPAVLEGPRGSVVVNRARLVGARDASLPIGAFVPDTQGRLLLACSDAVFELVETMSLDWDELEPEEARQILLGP